MNLNFAPFSCNKSFSMRWRKPRFSNKWWSFRKFLAVIFFVIWFWAWRNTVKFDFVSIEPVLRENKTKSVLIWTGFFGDMRPFGYIIEGTGKDSLEKNCPYKCYFHRNRSLLNESDALIFHGRGWQGRTPKRGDKMQLIWDRPKTRLASQFYVFYLWENPLNTFVPLESFANFFNATMTYRRDSDIFAPTGRLIARQFNQTGLSEMPMLNKTKLVAWIVSNCNADSKREKLAAELRKYIPIDIYGGCGQKCKSDSVPSKTSIISRKRFHNPCFDEVAQTHKFYLAFENSFCKDYLTEKFWSALEAGMVPIVYGSANYSLHAPKYSFIDVRNFASMKTLAQYLIFLDTHPEEYEKYFEWRKYLRVDPVSFITNAFCSLCEKLTTGDLRTKPAIRDFKSWWRGRNDEFCKVENKL